MPAPMTTTRASPGFVLNKTSSGRVLAGRSRRSAGQCGPPFYWRRESLIGDGGAPVIGHGDAPAGLVVRPGRRFGSSLLVEDAIGLAVDLLLLARCQVALLHLLGRTRLGVARVGLVGHRVLLLVGQAEVGLRLGVPLLGRQLSHVRSPLPLGLPIGLAARD